MPRSQGTSRKGKPRKQDRAMGMGKALQRAQTGASGGNNKSKYRPRPNGKNVSGDGGMAMQPGVQSIGGADSASAAQHEAENKTMSVLELQDLDDFLIRAELAQTQFTSEREQMVVLDQTATAYHGPSSNDAVSNSNIAAATTPKFVFKELSVPRRPQWDSSTTPEELDRREKESFLDWRRIIAQQEEFLYSSNHNNSRSATTTTMHHQHHHHQQIHVSPFEKNLEIWKQLWRVMEQSSCLVLIADARNPLFYLSQDLRQYCCVELDKPLVVLINKSDYLTRKQRTVWKRRLVENEGWTHVMFFSATREQHRLDEAAQQSRRREEEEEELLGQQHNVASREEEEEDDDDDDDDESDEEKKEEEGDADDADTDQPSRHDQESSTATKHNANNNESTADATKETTSSVPQQQQQQQQQLLYDGVDEPLTRQQLLETMADFAQRQPNCIPSERFPGRTQWGFTGFPNVGKSSVINVLLGTSKHDGHHGTGTRVGVAAQPGKTKHYQTLFIPDYDDVILCDCPGLVFPSFCSSQADLIAAGVYPIAQMRDWQSVIHLICQRIPIEVMNAVYTINVQHNRSTSWSAETTTLEETFLSTLCHARSLLSASSGVPDYQRAARMVVSDYATGKLLYCHPPPSTNNSNESGSGLVDDADNMDDWFHRETLITAIQNSKKLREKKKDLTSLIEEGTDDNDDEIDDSTASSGGLNDDDDDDDFDNGEEDNGEDNLLLELMLEDEKTALRGDAQVDGRKQHQNGRKKRGWGKKNRKNRNKDPYGCHSAEDTAELTTMMSLASTSSSHTGSGVIVNAGKYGRRGYTRPAYAGSRAAAAVPTASK